MNAVEQADARALMADPRHPWAWVVGMRALDGSAIAGHGWRRLASGGWQGEPSGYCAGGLTRPHWPDLDDPPTAGWLVWGLAQRYPLRRLAVYFGPCADGTTRWSVDGYHGRTMGHAAARALLGGGT